MRSAFPVIALAVLLAAVGPADAGNGGSHPPLNCKLRPNFTRNCGTPRNTGGGDDTPLTAPNNGTPEQQDQCFLDCTGHTPYHSQQVSDTCKASCYGGSH